MDRQHVEKDALTRSRRAYIGWWLSLGLVVVLAVVVHFAYHPTRSTTATPPPESMVVVTQDETARAVDTVAPRAVGRTLPRELVEMEAAGVVTLARPAAVPRELVEMEAAGLVTLARR